MGKTNEYTLKGQMNGIDAPKNATSKMEDGMENVKNHFRAKVKADLSKMKTNPKGCFFLQNRTYFVNFSLVN